MTRKYEITEFTQTVLDCDTDTVEDGIAQMETFFEKDNTDINDFHPNFWREVKEYKDETLPDEIPAARMNAILQEMFQALYPNECDFEIFLAEMETLGLTDREVAILKRIAYGED